MEPRWFYSQRRQKIGPISEFVLHDLIANKSLDQETYVWRKGFEEWKRLKDVTEIHLALTTNKNITYAMREGSDFDNWEKLNSDKKVIFLKENSENNENNLYGPYNRHQIKKLFDKKYLNENWLFFIASMKNWLKIKRSTYLQKYLGLRTEQYNEPEFIKKPFVAQFKELEAQTFIGCCRDLNLGGFQLLLDASKLKSKVGDKLLVTIYPNNSIKTKIEEKMIVNRLMVGAQGVSLRFDKLSYKGFFTLNKYLDDFDKNKD